MSTLILLALSFAGLWLALYATGALLRAMGMLRPNFRGETIPVGYGLAIVAWSVPALLWMARALPERREQSFAFLAVTAGFAALGFVDDRWGDRSVGGLRGHLRKFFQGEITTGLVKMAGGAVLAFAVPWRMLHHAWTDALLEGALIALCANAFNLLDLRPGRAGALFLACALQLAFVEWRAWGAPPPLLCVMIPAIVVYERDARGKVMLGDTGSNLLGAALGMSVVPMEPATGTKWAIVASLAALHLAAERWSITKVIENSPVLRKLDRWTGVR